VLVGHDVAFLVDDEAAARSARRGLYFDHSVLHALVDRGRGRQRLGDRLRCGLGGRRGGIVVRLQSHACANSASDACCEQKRRSDRCYLLAHGLNRTGYA
jgi:hypothetical protein